MSANGRDRLNELLGAFSLGDGCATCLVWVIIIVALVVCVFALWVLFTTPSPPPLKWDPSLATQLPGNEQWTPQSMHRDLEPPLAAARQTGIFGRGTP